VSISQPTWKRRSRAATVILVSALCGGVGAAAYGSMALEGSTPLATTPTSEPAEAELAAFTDADTGSCLNWRPGENGSNSDFTTVGCAEQHRFEISAREDLSQYPTSEFDEDAEHPSLERQQQLTDELCVGPTLNYLNGKLDPEGRYTISPILPPASAWAEGDRTMLCGVMVQDAQGRSTETVGLAAESDQSRAFPADTCVQVINDSPVEVPCNEDHSWQVTDVVNLGEGFPQDWPDIDKQNEYLNQRCTEAARNYLGGDDALYNSTLTPFWTTIQSQSWAAGSRTVNCALTFGRPDGGFANLNGDVRQGFTIDGNPPAKQPPRNPLRNNAAAASPAPAAP